MLVRHLYPAQGMLHPAEIALRRIGKQPAAAGAAAPDSAATGRSASFWSPSVQRPLPPGAQSPARPGRHPRARNPPCRAQPARLRPGQCLTNRVIVYPQLG